MKQIVAALFSLLLVWPSVASLEFTDGSSDVVNHGNDTSLEDFTAGTFILWVYPTTLTPAGYRNIVSKNKRRIAILQSAPARLEVKLFRATVHLEVQATWANVPNSGANKWNFWAGAYDTSGANGDQKLFGGDRDNTVAVVTIYNSQVVGSGTMTSDAGSDLGVGNFVAASQGFPGKIAFVGHWDRVLTLGEIKAQQFSPHVTSGCRLFVHYGFNGTGTQADWSGYMNNGTVTGATQDSHVPLGAPFASLWDWLRGWRFWRPAWA